MERCTNGNPRAAARLQAVASTQDGIQSGVPMQVASFQLAQQGVGQAARLKAERYAVSGPQAAQRDHGLVLSDPQLPGDRGVRAPAGKDDGSA